MTPAIEQRRHHDQAEPAVVEQAVEQHQPQADRAGDQARGELVGGQRRALLGDDRDVELQRQRAVLQAVGQRLRLGLREVAADLGLAVGDHAVDGRGGDHLAVEHDRELLLLAGQRAGLVGDRWVTLAKVLRAAPSKVRLTTHCTWFCGLPAAARS